jgi:hypothetical protein
VTHDHTVARFIAFLETGDAHPELFTAEVFVDFTLPRWRQQARGRDELIAMRRQGHPSPGKVTRWRTDPTPTGFVLELEEQWEQGGEPWYCREMFRADVEGDAIHELSVYCTGDWDTRRRAEHAREVRLLRP